MEQSDCSGQNSCGSKAQADFAFRRIGHEDASLSWSIIMDGLDEKAFGSLGWPDMDEISDFWIHDKKIPEFKIRNSESLLLGPVRHREV